MALFGFKTKTTQALCSWVCETNNRLQDNSITKNPFKGRIKLYTHKNEATVVCNLEPLWFNYTIFFWPMAIISYMVVKLAWPTILLSILGLFGAFWTTLFFYPISKLGLKKKGHTEALKLIGHKTIIQEVLINGNR